MASLANTKWEIIGDNNTWITNPVDFNETGTATIIEPNSDSGKTAEGKWTVGSEPSSFMLTYEYQGTLAKLRGTYEGESGSGSGTLDMGNGVTQNVTFEMKKVDAPQPSIPSPTFYNQRPFIPNGSYLQSSPEQITIELTASYSPDKQTGVFQYTDTDSANWDDIYLNESNNLARAGNSGNPSNGSYSPYIPEGSYQKAEGFKDVQVKLSTGFYVGGSSNEDGGWDPGTYIPCQVTFNLKDALEMTDIAFVNNQLEIIKK